MERDRPERANCSMRHARMVSPHKRRRTDNVGSGNSKRCISYRRQSNRTVCVGSRHQQGTAIVEAVIALPILLAVILGAIQFGLIYEAKATLNHAALQAARSGAVSNAQPDAIRRGLARGLAPLYSPESSLQGVAATVGRINAELLTDARVRILNPTREAFDDFGEEVEGVREIPNDRLHSRSTAAGASSGLNIQDANLLRIEITYGYALKVPLVNWFISRALLGMRRGSASTDAFERQLLRRGLLPIVSTSTVRMQSPARMSDAVVARADLPEVGRIPSNARPPDESDEDDDSDEAQEEGESGAGDDGGSNLSDGFSGFGGGSADPSGGGSTPGGGSSGGGGGNSGGGNSGGGNSGNPQQCSTEGGGSPQPPGTQPPGQPSLQASNASLPSVTLPSLSVGNPIHVVTGNKYQVEFDQAPLPGNLGLEFSRHYNSEATGYAGVMGAGWRHSYEASVSVLADSSIDLWQADGRHLLFRPSGEPGKFRAQRAGDGELHAREGGYVWHWSTGRELRFDARGRLLAIREGAKTLTLRYNDAGQLVSVIDPQQRVLQLDYYPNGRVSRVEIVGGAVWRYSYDAAGNLSQAVAADGSVRIYQHADARHPHHLTAIDAGTFLPTDYGGRNEREQVSRWEYDAQGRAILSSHPGDVGKVSLEYGDGYTDVTDSFGRVSRYITAVVDGVAFVREVRGPGCDSCGEGDVSYRFDRGFQLTEIASKNAPSLFYTYDDRRRLTQIERGSTAGRESIARYFYEGASGRPIRVEYPSVKLGATRAVEFEYRADGQIALLRETGYAPAPGGEFSAIERVVKFVYNSDAELIEIDGPRTDVPDLTQVEYDSLGRVIVVRAVGEIELRLDYDAMGRPVQLYRTGRPGLRLGYDSAGRVTELAELRVADERKILFRHDARGRLWEIVRPDGSSRRIAYDAAGRPDRVSDDGSDTATAVRYAPDDRLSAVAVLSRAGVPFRALQYVYDDRRRLIEVRDGEGPPLRQFTYLDGDSRPDRSVDPLGFETAFSYDDLGNIESILAPDGGLTRFSADRSGRLTGVTAPNDADTRYALDDFGRRVREESPDRGVTQYAYDAAGNLTQKVDAWGAKTRLSYDALNRLVRIERSDGATTLKYGSDHLIEVDGPTSQERLEYDADGQLVLHARTIAGRTFATRNSYSPDGKLQSRILPSGKHLKYHYATNGALRAITLERSFSGDVVVGELDAADGSSNPPLSAQGRLAFGNGLMTQSAYDAATGRLSRRTTPGLNDLRYRHDAAGRVIGIDANESRRGFDYDAVGRLTQARTSLGEFRYRYDLNGNRLASSISLSSAGTSAAVTRRDGARAASEDFAYEPGSNRLTRIRSHRAAEYRYDAAGNPTEIANRRYEYDASGRPSRLHVDGRLVASYEYNLSGERVSKTLFSDAQPRTAFYLYENHQLIAEADAKGAITREYVYLGHHPVAMLDGGSMYWIHTDHLGAPVAITDKRRRVVWTAEYEPFGEALVNEDPDGDGKAVSLNLRLPGQYADAESGTHYNIMRDYDPALGRYLTSDPIGLRGGANTFSYAGQNPISAIDPLGLYLFAFDGTWINRNSGVLTNVELFRKYYDPTFEEANSYYRAGLGTADPNQSDFENSVDRVLGGAFGLGGQQIISSALDRLDQLIRTADSPNPFDGVIDIVGFSRGAAIARAFANKIYERIDEGYYRNALETGRTCRSLRIRFMGLFDTVGSFGVPGNSVDTGYDFSIDDRVGTVAHAVALNEHRAAFDLISIQDFEHSPNTTTYREERGFVGAHSDIGGGYSVGDLSDLALQWVYKKAVAAGVRMTPLGGEHLAVSAPIIHDERSFPQDREIFYPSDPGWRPAVCSGSPIRCLFWEPPATQRQLTAPQFQFPELRDMIRSNPQPDAVLGTVDMDRYSSWLRTRGLL